MENDWTEKTLGEVIELKRGYDLPRQSRVQGKVPVVSSAGVSDFHIRAKVKGPGVVTGRYGTIGKVFYIRTDFWPLNTTLYVRDFKNNDPRFINYFLQDFDFAVYSDKAAVPGLNRNHLHQARVTIPQLHQQRVIARVLGVLDDKIELNRRMNRTLEELAEALFRSWFVDFDPVVAKAAGRQPAHLRPDLAALFPAHWQDSPLGPIPHGWRVGTVDELTNVTMGQSPPGSSYNEIGEGFPFFQGCTDFGFRFPTNRVFCTAPTRFAKKGDILLSVRAPVGDTNIALEDCTVGRGLAALRGRNGERSFPLYAIRSQADEFASYEGEGTLFGAINGPALRGLRLVVPPAPVMEAFEKTAGPWDAMIEHNERESRTLAALRDTLLPKLLSGELRVTNAVGIEGRTA